MSRLRRRIRPLKALWLLAPLALAMGGCVRTKVAVTSDPPGADVMMNGIHMGETPVEQPFKWFWYYDFVARKEGHEQAYTRERFRAPIYLWPPFDLLMEVLPVPITHTERVHLVLPPEEARPDAVFVEAVEP